MSLLCFFSAMMQLRRTTYSYLFLVGVKYSKDEKDETRKALVAAEEDAAQKAGNSGLLAAADENAEALLRGILEGSVGNREIVINHAN